MLDPKQIEETIPWVSGEGLAGGCWTPSDGHVTPPDGVAALSKAARKLGVRFQENWPVRDGVLAVSGQLDREPGTSEASDVLWKEAEIRVSQRSRQHGSERNSNKAGSMLDAALDEVRKAEAING